MVAAITSVCFVDNPLCLVSFKLLRFKQDISRVKSLCCQQDCLSVGLSPDFVLERLLELLELHVVSLVL